MEQATELVEQQPRPLAVFGSDRPADIVARATEVANVLAPIIEQKGLFKNIGGKRHVMAEGWATLMGLLNVDPIVEYCRRLDRKDEITYESRVLLVKNGITISAAETIASDMEKAAWSRSEQGVKSMAQTRAFGKACRLKFSWIVVLAGYAPTPAEEMPDERPIIQMPKAKSEIKTYGDTTTLETTKRDPEIEWENEAPKDQSVKPISDKQRKLLFVKCREANISENVFKAYIKENYRVEHTNELPWTAMTPTLEWIEKFKGLANG